MSNDPNKLFEVINRTVEDEQLQYPAIAIMAGRREKFTPQSHNIFETTFVDRMVRNCDGLSTPVGWEVAYPSSGDAVQTLWKHSRVDFALGYLGETNAEEDHLFRYPVEVKRWAGRTAENPENIWVDVFKISGYWHAVNKEAGARKFVLVVFPQGECTKEKAEEVFTGPRKEDKWGELLRKYGWDKSVDWALKRFDLTKSPAKVAEFWDGRGPGQKIGVCLLEVQALPM